MLRGDIDQAGAAPQLHRELFGHALEQVFIIHRTRRESFQKAGIDREAAVLHRPQEQIVAQEILLDRLEQLERAQILGRDALDIDHLLRGLLDLDNGPRGVDFRSLSQPRGAGHHGHDEASGEQPRASAEQVIECGPGNGRRSSVELARSVRFRGHG